MIGRALAARGYTTITGNTRMHDLGNVAGYRNGRRIRGGGYWGVASEEVRDLAAWVDFAEAQGFKRLLLVGHSAGWAAVRAYQADRQDPRVVGVVLASGAVRAETRPTDPKQLADATRMMAAGNPDDLVRIPTEPSLPSSARRPFWTSPTRVRNSRISSGSRREIPASRVSTVRFSRSLAPRGDVGTEADLELLKSSIQRQGSGPSRVTTAMIQNADHMYTGEEAQVAETIAQWAESLRPPSSSGRGDVSGKR